MIESWAQFIKSIQQENNCFEEDKDTLNIIESEELWNLNQNSWIMNSKLNQHKINDSSDYLSKFVNKYIPKLGRSQLKSPK